MDPTLEQHLTAYQTLLAAQRFVAEDLDYAVFERHRPFLEQLDSIENSSVSVFDLYQRKHLFFSAKFETVLGYDLTRAEAEDTAYLNRQIHPEDFLQLMIAGNAFLRFAFALPVPERKHYKVINEYRIRKGDGTYTRIIEQHKALELDPHGNIWLALSVTDLSPDADLSAPLRSRLVNTHTGAFYFFPPPEPEPADPLTPREKEILGLIARGLISKQIADQLYISVHTVNTHRQRIIEKLEVNNTFEAVTYAANLGLLA